MVCGIKLLLYHYRFGICEPYEGIIDICNDIFSAGVDYVFITKGLESQRRISEFLNASIPRSLSIKSDYCRTEIKKIICNYYFVPCGSENSELPPTSICPEECSLVEEACPSAWESLTLGLRDYGFIDCNDTS